MLDWQSGVDLCHDNGSKTLPVVSDGATDRAFMDVLRRLPLGMRLCPVWLHLTVSSTLRAALPWQWADNSAAGMPAHVVLYTSMLVCGTRSFQCFDAVGWAAGRASGL